jgi:muconolactone delta-isomerase
MVSKGQINTTNREYVTFLDQNVASMEYSESLEQQGKVVYHGIVAGSSKSFWIVEAATAEEVDELVKGIPVFPNLEISIRPLVSPTHVLNEIKTFMKNNPLI